jgi:hypothetical protein
MRIQAPEVTASRNNPAILCAPKAQPPCVARNENAKKAWIQKPPLTLGWEGPCMFCVGGIMPFNGYFLVFGFCEMSSSHSGEYEAGTKVCEEIFISNQSISYNTS